MAYVTRAGLFVSPGGLGTPAFEFTPLDDTGAPVAAATAGTAGSIYRYYSDAAGVNIHPTTPGGDAFYVGEVGYYLELVDYTSVSVRWPGYGGPGGPVLSPDSQTIPDYGNPTDWFEVYRYDGFTSDVIGYDVRTAGVTALDGYQTDVNRITDPSSTVGVYYLANMVAPGLENGDVTVMFVEPYVATVPTFLRQRQSPVRSPSRVSWL